jgi:uncharacterized Zn-binding protein involved in type VI secretion
MPGFLYHVGAQATCFHAAPAATVSANARVLVSGQPVATMADTTTVAGCPFQVPVPGGTKPQPCVRVQWTVGAQRVLVNGQPALLQTSTGTCLSVEQIPQGVPAITFTQTRVSGI